MIISRTPFRISFFGGGTDYPAWFSVNAGAVLSVTINRYCYLSCRHMPQFFDYRSRIVWSQIELVEKNDEIVHPVVREVLKLHKLEGLSIHHDADLPSRAGLGSSSAFTVGLLNALSGLQGSMLSKQQLAEQAIHLEKNILAENVGIQDQIAAAYGGLNKIEINKRGEFQVNPLTISKNRRQELCSHLMLFYTGTSRIASEIAEEQIKAIPNKEVELRRIRELVDQAVELLISAADIREFGSLLNETWTLKRQLSSRVSTDQVDEIYTMAMRSGALGGKLLGAGGGGFLLFFVPPLKQAAVASALGQLLQVPIQFDDKGTQIVFFDP